MEQIKKLKTNLKIILHYLSIKDCHLRAQYASKYKSNFYNLFYKYIKYGVGALMRKPKNKNINKDDLLKSMNKDELISIINIQNNHLKRESNKLTKEEIKELKDKGALFGSIKKQLDFFDIPESSYYSKYKKVEKEI
jgi:hypothetical protein